MVSSGEKIIFVVILLITCCLAFFGIIPMFFLKRHIPIEGSLMGSSMIFPLAILPLLLLSVVWLFVVVWVYRDAKRRGMSGVLWALLVLVGNFVGLLIYFIVRNDELSRQFSAGLTGSMPRLWQSCCPKICLLPALWNQDESRMPIL